MKKKVLTMLVLSLLLAVGVTSAAWAEESDYLFGVASSDPFSDVEHYNGDGICINGDDKVYYLSANGNIVKNNYLLIYTQSGDRLNVKEVYAHKEGMKDDTAEVTGLNDGLIVFDNDITVYDFGKNSKDPIGKNATTNVDAVMTNRDTVVYVIGSDGKYTLGSLDDVSKGSYVLVPVVDEDGYADLVIVDEYTDYTNVARLPKQDLKWQDEKSYIYIVNNLENLPFIKAANNLSENGGAITYSSTDETVAVVDAVSGEVKIVGVGRTNIVAMAAAVENKYKQTSIVCRLDVAPPADDYGTCGHYATWGYDESTKTLTISGTGAITDNSGYSAYKDLIKKVIIEDGVDGIAKQSFSDFIALTDIDIPDSVKYIGDESFYSCVFLTEINIPDSVTEIGWRAFSGCKSLTKVVLPKDITEIPNRIFENCISLTDLIIPNGVTEIGGEAFYGCSALTKIIIPNSVTNIGNLAFRQCSSLTGITIPSNVVEIGELAFVYCSSLNNIDVVNDNNNFTSIDGVLFNKNKSQLICYPMAKEVKEYKIPNAVISIGHWAFAGCKNLTNIIIPEGVVRIDSWAFSDVSNLKNITIPVSVLKIGECAFMGAGHFDIPNKRWDVYYAGTKEQWEKLSVISLDWANIHYNSTGSGSGTGSGGGGGSSSGGGGGGSSSGGGSSKPNDDKKDETKPTDSKITASNIDTVFADVKPGQWYDEAVAYVYNNGIMKGTDNGGFAPNQSTTRGQIATMLYRLENEPAAGAASFTDVKPGQWYAPAVAWAAEQKIVSGYANGAFGPEDNVTREQLAAILYRYAEAKQYDVTAKKALTGFSDGAAVSGWAAEAMQWAVGSGLLNGSDGALNPQGKATRAEIAAILMRFCENIAK